jgi:hypothetical protein
LACRARCALLVLQQMMPRVWEVFVLAVLEQQTQQGRLYDQARPLQLFS